MVNYLAVMLVNLVIALALLVLFFAKYLRDDPKVIAPGFLATGFIGVMTSLHMMYTQPLPGTYSVAFGEPMMLFAVLLFVAGLAILKEWDLTALGVFSIFAGAVAVLVGIELMTFGMTRSPVMSGLGFISAGLAGVVFLPAYLTRDRAPLRMLAALFALISFVLWIVTAYGAFWGHIAPEG